VTKANPNPVEYAEQHLGVHDAYDRAQNARLDYDAAAVKVNAASAAIRYLHEMILSREQEVSAEQRGLNPQMSATGFGQHLKAELQIDDKMEEYRLKIIEEQGNKDTADAMADSAKYRIKIESARLEELGGLLNFYAAAKYATSQNHTSKNGAT
jgi:hypothetical protein